MPQLGFFKEAPSKVRVESIAVGSREFRESRFRALGLWALGLKVYG